MQPCATYPYTVRVRVIETAPVGAASQFLSRRKKPVVQPASFWFLTTRTLRDPRRIAVYRLSEGSKYSSILTTSRHASNRRGGCTLAVHLGATRAPRAPSVYAVCTVFVQCILANFLEYACNGSVIAKIITWLWESTGTGARAGRTRLRRARVQTPNRSIEKMSPSPFPNRSTNRATPASRQEFCGGCAPVRLCTLFAMCENSMVLFEFVSISCV